MPFDTSPIRRAVSRLGPVSKKDTRELMTSAARGFIKTVVGITPPASAKATGAAARKIGEAAVQTDVLRLAQPVLAIGPNARTVLASAADLLAAHARARVNSSGRVNPRNRREKLFATQQTVLAVIRKLQLNVGWLAAGWNPAAKKLGVNLPAWIRRHTAAAGSAVEADAAGKFRLTLSNEVGFVGNVKDYENRVGKAIQYEAGKLNRQADFLLRKSLRRAGF